MSSHADTLDIANAASGLLGCDAVHPYDPDAAYRAAREWADLLLAENQRYEKALEVIERGVLESGSRGSAAWASRIAREALAGDAE